MTALSWAQVSPCLLSRQTVDLTRASATWNDQVTIAGARTATVHCLQSSPLSLKQRSLGGVQEGARRHFSHGQGGLRRSRVFCPPICAKETAEMEAVTVVAEPPQGNELKVRVDVSGNETQRIYSSTIFELSKSTPPGPGFRKAKGGKTALVSKEVLLHMLGPKKVKGFVIDRIVNQTLADYVEKEGLGAKKEAKTVQSADDLMAAFTPGKTFGFDATLILEEKESQEDDVIDVEVAA
eukprot:TRINITY_DN17327_c0_g1_i1.p1 TRINITY_DN17327_c0_g1~~TRINITY_DN17327_c0_g1_i1.p1  ORF type:complete len:246 (-),score=57.38 TRINITY_DN17327_c0_g1_i1:728-1441(-)